MLWGSEIRWNGTCHILDRITLVYDQLARIITSLPQWTPLRFLYKEAGMPPLNMLLDHMSQAYGVRTICQKDIHPCKSPLLRMVMASNTKPQNGRGLQGIADLVRELIQDDLALEDIDYDHNAFLPEPENVLGKEEEAKRHKK